MPDNDLNLKQTIGMGCWSEEEVHQGETGDWQAKKISNDSSHFTQCSIKGEQVGEVCWGLSGEHNMQNGLMAIVMAAHHVGVLPVDACAALNKFINARRRLELRG